MAQIVVNVNKYLNSTGTKPNGHGIWIFLVTSNHSKYADIYRGEAGYGKCLRLLKEHLRKEKLVDYSISLVSWELAKRKINDD